MAGTTEQAESIKNVKDFIGRGQKAQAAVTEIIKRSESKNGNPKPVSRSVSQVQITTDYDAFKRLAGNRPVIQAHVNQLVDRMRKHDLLVPVIVNEKMQVIDGQHRIEARRELGLPVPYIQGTGMDLSDVQMLNSTSRGWVSDDYARSYVEQGNQHYVTYMDFRKTWGLPHEVSLLLLAGRGPKALRKAFVTGEFRIHDLEGARAMASLLHTKIRPVWEAGWKDAYFIRALYIPQSRVGFQMERFLKAVVTQKNQLSVYRSVDASLLMIENIYNSPAGLTKVPIRYGVSVRDSTGHAEMSDAKRRSLTAKELEKRENHSAGRRRTIAAEKSGKVPVETRREKGIAKMKATKKANAAAKREVKIVKGGSKNA